MDSSIDQQIADALVELVSTTGEEYQFPEAAHLLREQKERFYETYKTNSLIVSLYRITTAIHKNRLQIARTIELGASKTLG